MKLNTPVAAFALLAASVASADVRLPAVFSDHLVLQKSSRTALWGTADAGETVHAQIGDTRASAIASPEGRWRITVDLSNAPAGPHELVVEGKNRLVITDVLVGEVWLASGQSNMAFPLKGSTSGAKDAMQESNPGSSPVREFLVTRRESRIPLEDCEGRWVVGTPENVGSFSAVAYYFAKRLQASVPVPVGIVNSSYGGTPIESWISAEGRAVDTELDAFAKVRLQRGTAALANKTKEFRASEAPASLYNAMIHPLTRVTLRGVIWYQGENNTGGATRYRRSFPILIKDWRRAWGHDLPFYFCQLPNYKEAMSEISPSSWAEMREAQDQALLLPHTGRAVIFDTGEAEDIHPQNKKTPGERLALLALAKTYDLSVPHESPRYDSARIEGARIRISFKNNPRLVARPVPETYLLKTGSGGTTRPVIRNSPDSQLEGFILCGEDRVWHWANAFIEDSTVIVSSPQVPHPVAVRYAWSHNPIINLYDDSGLPAAPFRTDNFPLFL